MSSRKQAEKSRIGKGPSWRQDSWADPMLTDGHRLRKEAPTVKKW